MPYLMMKENEQFLNYLMSEDCDTKSAVYFIGSGSGLPNYNPIYSRLPLAALVIF